MKFGNITQPTETVTGIDWPSTSIGLLAHRIDDAVHRGRDHVFRALRQHDAEAVAAEAADHVAGAHEAVEALAHRHQDGVADLVAVGAVDEGELVDADHQERAGGREAAREAERLLQLLAQARLVEMAGEVVVIGGALQARLGLLALGDDAQGARHGLGDAGAAHLREAAVVHPHHLAVAGAQAVFAVIDLAEREMVGQRLQAARQVLGMDAVIERVAGRHRLQRDVGQDIGEIAGPDQPVARHVPGIGDIAGGDQRVLDPFRRRPARPIGGRFFDFRISDRHGHGHPIRIGGD